jgi:peptidoglycan/LPS O-acetylase OafA/YrhL
VKQRYIPAIDGLRAVAIVSVVLFHVNKQWVPSGYLGVDVFFVISGFLITRILNSKDAEPTASYLISFYLQRVRRIAPALLVLSSAFLLIAAFTEGYFSFHFIASQIPAALLSYSNFLNYNIIGDYFGEKADSFHFLHCWSLSVEEQFYLIFPIFFLSLRFFLKSKLLKTSLLLLTFLSLSSSCYFHLNDPAAGFYLPWNRAWELLIGSLVALQKPPLINSFPRLSKERINIFLSFALLLVIFFLFVDSSNRPRLQILLTLSACCVIFVVLTTLSQFSDCSCLLLEIPPIRFLGKISYSVYLWHWPIIVLVNNHLDAPLFSISKGLEVPVILSLIVLCSTLSFLFIENPLRRQRSTPYYIVPATLLFAFLLYAFLPALQSTPLSRYPPVIVFGNRFCYNPVSRTNSNHGSSTSVYFPAYSTNRFLKQSQIGSQKTNKHILFFGNSHGLAVAPILNRFAAQERYTIHNLFANAVSPSLFRPKGPHGGEGISSAEVDQFDLLRRQALESGAGLCVMVMRYDNMSLSDMAPTFDFILSHVPMLFVQQAPVLNIGQKNAVDRFNELVAQGGSADRLNVHEPKDIQIRREQFEAELLARYSKDQDFHFLKTSDLFVNSNGTVKWNNGYNILYYFDDDHLTENGSMLFSERLTNSIKSLIGHQIHF